MKRTICLSIFLLLFSCQTRRSAKNTSTLKVGKYSKETITSKTPTSRVVNIALDKDQKTVEIARKLITVRSDWKKVMPQLESLILKVPVEIYRNQERILRATSIYLGSTEPANPKFFSKLMNSDHLFHFKIALLIAGNMPSREVASVLDAHLSKIVVLDDKSRLHNPILANAIMANNLGSSYSLMRASLMATGHESFAEAMAALAPRQASDDFLNYLAKASIEELRQLTVKSINLIACDVILKHLAKYPPTVTHQNIIQLFHYSVSRNQLLSHLAQSALKPQLKRHRTYLATMLARMPAWLQISFVENLKYDMSRDRKLFASDLRSVSVNDDVIYEIDSLRL